MNEKDWLIIHTVWQHQNITRAARQLYTSQPALSYRLKQIERKLGIALFEESGRQMTFSAQGRYLAQHAARVLNDSLQLRQTLQSLSQPRQGELRIGVTSNFAAYRLPDILARFAEIHSGIRVNLISGLSEEMYQKLQREEIQVALVKDDYHWRNGKRLVDEDDYWLVSQQPLDLRLLPQLPQIRINHGGHVTHLIERWWNANYSLSPRVAMQVDKLEVCLAMVERGLGYAIVSSYQPLAEGLCRQPIRVAGEALKSRTWLLYHHASSDASVILPFVEMFPDLGVSQN
ncbi:LysR family transcriptional regulator [Pantoea latae]|jgi:DNA-binding transcriptional LysR family regulator|uniref:LysR family transcriptional regulator n=1 Tax=Pantoea latae TaxID=1964541 RepID=A0A1V9D9X9_9GAMM|nr:LysR family transcriptional regulator [Pantoea latae]OQP30710.1 LysR family transcriptional regulator [Pantoea latae]